MLEEENQGGFLGFEFEFLVICGGVVYGVGKLEGRVGLDWEVMGVILKYFVGMLMEMVSRQLYLEVQSLGENGVGGII